MFTWSERLYGALLFLYPARFRVRFGGEMMQIFHDCRLDSKDDAGIAAFWWSTLKDLLFSLPREWRMEPSFWRREPDYTGRADLFMISIIVGTNLVGWSAVGPTFLVSLTTGTLGAFIAARTNRIEQKRLLIR